MSDLDIAMMQERQYVSQDLNHLVKWMQDEFAKIHQRLGNIEKDINPSLKSDFDKMAANAVALEVKWLNLLEVAERMADGLRWIDKCEGPLLGRAKEALALFEAIRAPVPPKQEGE